MAHPSDEEDPVTFNVDAMPFSALCLVVAVVVWRTRGRFDAAKERRRQEPALLQMHGEPRVLAVVCVLASVAVLIYPFE